MTRELPLRTEVPLAFLAGVVAFTGLAVPLAATESDAFAVGLGAAALGAVAAMLRLWGVAYAVPAAIAGLLAFDWFALPPTHAPEFLRTVDLLELAAYLGVGVVVGVLAARAGRRAEMSEVARAVLTEEQAALRRVATLVAQNAPSRDVFETVTREVGLLLDADLAVMMRNEADGTAACVAAWSAGDARPARDGPAPLPDARLMKRIAATGRPARVYDSVGSPIVVEGRLWGALIVQSPIMRDFPPDVEPRLMHFTELVAAAIGNAESRSALTA